MCGIFCFVQHNSVKTWKAILEVLLNGLKRLEYRGYDSAGIQVKFGDEPIVIKKQGDVNTLRAHIFDNYFFGETLDTTENNHIGMAHTRWATHGEPCDRNAHPQHSSDHSFFVVHNGVMTNFAAMRQFLQGKEYVFFSDTDTEVIANLAHFCYHAHHDGKATFSQVIREVAAMTEGAFAMIFTSPLYPGELVACRRGSPLILGCSDESAWIHRSSGSSEIFLSSDSTSIVEHSKRVVFLEDNDFVHIVDGRIQIVNQDPKKPLHEHCDAPRKFCELEFELESLSRGNYSHYMLKEIFEQPESLRNTCRGRLIGADDIRLSGFLKHARALQNAHRIILIACGTSLHSCLAARPLFDELVNAPCAVENASDFLDRSPPVYRSDICIFVSQSGETADTLRALNYCRSHAAMVVGITNVVGSNVSRGTDFGVHLNAGVEVGVASTKAYTSQIVTLVMIALFLSRDTLSQVQRREEIASAIRQLPSLVAECLELVHSRTKEIAARLFRTQSILVLGRRYELATAMEAALKISELAYIHSQGVNASELKHGPLALIEENLPVLVLCPSDHFAERTRATVQQICARGGKPIVIVTAEDTELKALGCDMIRVPSTVDCLQGIVNIIPLQLLAFHMAVLRGNNVDFPRNLAKSVTVQ